jgi:hypothetical protein
MGPGGGQPAKSPSPSARFYVSLARGFMDTCLHEKGKAKAVENVSGGRITWPAGHVARPASHHLASYRLNQVSNLSLDPCKYRSTGGNQNTHHNLEILRGPTGFLGSSLLECLCSSTLGEAGVPACQDHSTSMPQIWVVYHHHS